MQTRKSSRAIVLNEQNQIFLFRYTFDFFAEKESIWITPGGGLDDGESFEEALKRELFEELGIELSGSDSTPQIYYRFPLYELKSGKTVQSEERFYLVRLDETEFSYAGWTENENKRMTAGKWWSLEKIKQSKEKFFSEDVVEIMERLSEGDIPGEPEEIR
ncbi:MAG: NUDIX domain-containing protein [Lachnospiraceae bacterium]|nr:NUDIX domain-containing protein [Lachnospiraceae bacterium]